ncbi:hypothetical protein Tco_0023082, partial [Tanacetum coccineum]
PRFLILPDRAGIPLYTECKSQYCKKTEIMFQIAKVTAEAIIDTKLMLNPVTTGANSMLIRSILRIREFIFVRKFEECPSDITTILSRYTESISLSLAKKMIDNDTLSLTFEVRHDMSTSNR